jgi:hypothetical protein
MNVKNGSFIKDGKKWTDGEMTKRIILRNYHHQQTPMPKFTGTCGSKTNEI